MQKEIKVNGKTFIVKELLATEADDINWDDKKEAVKKQVMLSTGMTEEEYKGLFVRERVAIIKAITEINFEDFPLPNQD